MRTYTVEVSRDGRSWMVWVPEVERVTHARNLGEVETMARDLIEIMTGEPASDVELDVQIALPEPVAERLAEVERLRRVEADAKAGAARALRDAAAELKDSGLSVRELGKVLGVSYQRASQLTSSGA